MKKHISLKKVYWTVAVFIFLIVPYGAQAAIPNLFGMQVADKGTNGVNNNYASCAAAVADGKYGAAGYSPDANTSSPPTSWSGQVKDDDGNDPDCVRMYIGGVAIPANTDFRLWIKTEDCIPAGFPFPPVCMGNWSYGAPQATPWASEGSAWSNWADPWDGSSSFHPYDPDIWYVTVETRPMPISGASITNYRIGFQLGDEPSAAGCNTILSPITYTNYLSQGAGWSAWVDTPPYTGNPSGGSFNFNCVRLKIEPTISYTAPTISYFYVRNVTLNTAWSSTPITIRPGDQIAVAWSSANATSCNGTGFTTGGALANGGTANNADGTSIVEPTTGNTSTYTLTCVNAAGTPVSQSVQVTALSAPVTSIWVKNITTNGAEQTSNMTIGSTDEVQIRWSGSNSPTSCTAAASPADTSFSTGNAAAGTDNTVTEPTTGSSRTFSVTCTNGSGSHTASITVTRTAAPSTPTGLTASCTTAGAATLSWNATPTATSYHVRIDLAGAICPAGWNTSGTVCYKDYYPSTSVGPFTIPLSTTYSWYIYAVNGGGYSVPAAWSTVACPNPGPDLVATNVSASGTLSAGQTITFVGNIQNSGNAAGGASTARFCIDNSNCLNTTTGIVGADAAVAALGIGATSAQISRTWTATSGSHTLYVCADVGKVVLEPNEANNCTSYPITIGAASPLTTTVQARKAGTTAWQTGTVSINTGDNVEINWSATGSPTSCTATAGPADFSTGGATVGPDTTVTEPATFGASTVFTVSCTNGVNTDVDSVTVTKVARNCTVNGFSVAHGATATFYSTSSVAYDDLCTNYDLSSTCTDGTMSPAVGGTYIYQTCNVQTTPTQNNVTLTASPATVRAGGSTTLTWNGGNSEACTVKNSAGTTLASSVSGNLSLTVNQKDIFTLRCTLDTQVDTASVTVNLVPEVIEI